MKTKTITLVGCGHMGKALLEGWLRSKIKAKYIVIEPSGLPPAFKGKKNVAHIKTANKTVAASDVIVLAVKPQVMEDICEGLKPFVAQKSLVLSIAAGRSIASFEKLFSKKQPVVRSMPNLPANIGKGMTVAVVNKNASPAQRKMADQLLRAVGDVEWLKSEKLINAATAIVGNGPAYVFYLIEALTAAAIHAGIGPKIAPALARQTVIGGAALAEARPETDAATLRKNVTSPGGTTEAALKILMNGEMQRLFDEAIMAGAKRGEELSA